MVSRQSTKESAVVLRDPISTMAIVQGLYYFLTGVWPLVHMKSFLAVTGPKRDLWLVQTVGGLIGVIGLSLLAAGLRRRVTPEIKLLALGSAAFLGTVDTTFVAQKRIPPIYLADAVTEAALIAAWTAAMKRRSRGERDRGI